CGPPPRPRSDRVEQRLDREAGALGCGIHLRATREQELWILARERDAAHLGVARERFPEQPEVLAQSTAPRRERPHQRNPHRRRRPPARADAQVMRPRRSNWNGTTCPPRCSSAFATRCLRSKRVRNRKYPPPPAPGVLPPIAPSRGARR